jgi:hypothetical protein
MNDLEWAVSELSGANPRQKRYKDYKKYYDGDHPLAFATRKFRSTFWGIFSQFADNLCASVVDVQSERLEMVGFTASDATTAMDEATGVVTVSDKTGDAAWNLWEDEDLHLVADEVHKDALQYGDGFTITETDGSVWPQEPQQMAVRYSEERPGEIEVAAKIWKDPGTGYMLLNLYYPQRMISYSTTRKPQQDGAISAKMFQLITQEVLTAMPVSHFPNRAYSCYGRSELKPVLPLQDALNKSIIDMLVSSEYQAFRQRWITGQDVQLDENGRPKAFAAAHGPGEFLAIPDAEATVGEFGQADLRPLQEVVNDFRGEVARVSGIPLHYFFVSGQTAPSGESLKTSELRFTRKGKRQQRCFGKGWENAVLAALVVTDEATPSVDLNAVWDPITTRSESEQLDVLVKKQALGVPNSQLQKEAGYDPDQIRQFAAEAPPDVHENTVIDEAAPAPDAPPALPLPA